MRVSRRLELIGLAAIAAMVFLAAPVRAAATYPNQKEADYVAREFKFQTGDLLPEVRLHYTTLGTPQRDGAGHVTNAVLMLHGTTGTGKNFLNPTLAGEMFRPSHVLDASKYYVILPDRLWRRG